MCTNIHNFQRTDWLILVDLTQHLYGLFALKCASIVRGMANGRIVPAAVASRYLLRRKRIVPDLLFVGN